MLAAAKALFLDRGYSRTTMEEIADRSGFGVATLYTYFRTKEGMFAAMAREDMTELEEEGAEVLARLPEDPVEGLFSLVQVYLKVYRFISYALMEEFILQSKSSGPLRDISSWVIGWQQGQLSQALRDAQSRGQLASDLDVEHVSEIVVDLLIRYNQRVTSDPDAGLEKQRLRQAIAILLAGWLKEPADH